MGSWEPSEKEPGRWRLMPRYVNRWWGMFTDCFHVLPRGGGGALKTGSHSGFLGGFRGDYKFDSETISITDHGGSILTNL